MTLLFAGILLASACLWLYLSVPYLVGLTTTLLEWCSGLMDLCVSFVPVAATVLMWGAALVLAGGIIYSLARSVSGALRGRRALGRLPLLDTGGTVVLIRDERLKTAFTCGLLRPRIYVSTGLVRSLSRDELRSVILHEAHHRRVMDPLRAFAASTLRDAFFYLPIGGWLAGLAHRGGELAADRAVVEKTGDPLGFAETLVKVAVMGLAGEVPARAVGLSGRSPIEERVRTLLGEAPKGPKGPGTRAIAASAFAGVLLMLAMTLPLMASSYEPGGCTMERCSMHSAEMGPECTDHCSTH